MRSSYDEWLSHNPNDDKIIEISFAQWQKEKHLKEQYPFDSVVCDLCECSIGAHLHRDGTALYDTICITPSEQDICEECAYGL